jgi:hypothetical protein
MVIERSLGELNGTAGLSVSIRPLSSACLVFWLIGESFVRFRLTLSSLLIQRSEIQTEIGSIPNPATLFLQRLSSLHLAVANPAYHCI